jgi:hypothetical protein
MCPFLFIKKYFCLIFYMLYITKIYYLCIKLKDKTVITNRKKNFGQHGLAIVKDKESDFVG